MYYYDDDDSIGFKSTKKSKKKKNWWSRSGSSGGNWFSSRWYAPPRKEVIKPYLYFVDENTLIRSIDHYIQNLSEPYLREVYKLQGKEWDVNVNNEHLSHTIQSLWKDFPREIVCDLFQLNRNKIDNLHFAERGEHNQITYDILDKMNDPTIKILCADNSLISMIFTRSMILYYLMMLADMRQERKNETQRFMRNMLKPPPEKEDSNEKDDSGNDKTEDKSDENEDGSDENENSSGDNGEGKDLTGESSDKQGSATDQECSGNGSGAEGSNGKAQDNSSGSGSQVSGGSGIGKGTGRRDCDLSKALKDVLDNYMNGTPGTNNILEKTMRQARETAASIQTTLTEEQQKEQWGELAYGDLGKALTRLDPNALKDLVQSYRSVQMNMGSLNKILKTLLDRSLSYFSAKEEPITESLFDADSLHGFGDYELLHPKLRKLSLDDLTVKDVRKVGKINLYIDTSASMTESCGVGNSTKLGFAKVLAFKMKELGIIDKLYSFDDFVYDVPNSIFDILTLECCGGTRLNTVIKDIEKKQKNAIIITDAEDHCGIYSPYAFFLGVRGCAFNYFIKEVMAQYSENKQAIMFDGKRIYNVGSDGKIK